MFTLTCVVELVPEVDITVTVLTSWSKDGINITNTSRITADSMAVQTTTTTAVIYESDIMFDPLSNMQSGGDDGNYACSVQVKDQGFINGSSQTGTQDISVKGQYVTWRCQNYEPYSSPPDLGPPTVTVVTDGISTAGEAFSVEHIVETVEGVRPEDISITWTGPDGTVLSGNHPEMEDPDIEGLTTADSVIIGRLVFSPLLTSDRGQYTCTGRILISDVEVDVSNHSSIRINVTSEQ